MAAEVMCSLGFCSRPCWEIRFDHPRPESLDQRAACRISPPAGPWLVVASSVSQLMSWFEHVIFRIYKDSRRFSGSWLLVALPAELLLIIHRGGKR
jgi:hypothetical protein